jgi:hypothetical protein
MSAKHIGEKVLHDEQRIAVNAVAHRKEPASQPLF